ncbi:ECF transporter S component [Paucilactobacillus kaifaensis]|uniref:ECF transporter S component n=1 Tax=Paucilactobacillus kaifaensis TaxID=2559921 RepID=UPI0010F47B92|nr:ECF transporter S component [Paucilactobacillus kaifaensis]
MNQRARWHVRDIILLALIGILFGVIFLGTNFIYDGLTVALTPVGLAPLANDISMGLWIMAGPLAGFMLRIPGAGFLGEFLAAVGEMFFGGQWGASTMISGAIQGVAIELGFTLTGYRFYNWITLLLTTLTSTVGTFAWDMFRNGYAAFSPKMLFLLLVVRFISIFFFGGILVKLITSLLERSHVLHR